MGNSIADLRGKSGSTVVLVTSNGMGFTEEKLQHELLSIYLKLLMENEFVPGAICFYADGVKMVVEGSPVLEQLRELEAKGSRQIICITCLKYFGLEDKVAVGIVGGMSDILLAQWMADKVIAL